MTPEQIRAIALEVWDEGFDTDKNIGDFATRFLAAINAKAEPFCYHYITNGTWDFFTKELPPDDAYDEGTLTKLFTHPAIEPAPQAAFDQEIKDSDELLRLLNLPPDRYRTDGGCINLPKVRAAVREPWNYPTIDPVNPPVQSSVGAAPLPDEVQAMVERLRECDADLAQEAADMIERLAQQVPEGCVVVPRELLNGLCKYGHLHTVEGVAYSQGSHRELLGRASDLIAAGEVK